MRECGNENNARMRECMNAGMRRKTEERQRQRKKDKRCKTGKK